MPENFEIVQCLSNSVSWCLSSCRGIAGRSKKYYVVAVHGFVVTVTANFTDISLGVGTLQLLLHATFKKSLSCRYWYWSTYRKA